MVKTQDRENQIPLKKNPPIWKKIAKFGSRKNPHLCGIFSEHVYVLHGSIIGYKQITSGVVTATLPEHVKQTYEVLFILCTISWSVNGRQLAYMET